MHIKSPVPHADTHLSSVKHTDLFSQMTIIHSFIHSFTIIFLLVAYSVGGPTRRGVTCALTHSSFLTHEFASLLSLSTTTLACTLEVRSGTRFWKGPLSKLERNLGVSPQGNSVFPFKMDGREKETGRGGRGKEEGREGRREGTRGKREKN